MHISIKINVVVDFISAQLSIFKEEDRPEVIPLLTAISESESANTDPVTYLIENHFPDLPITFVANLLEELRLMGLVQDGILTTHGIETLKRKEVLVPRKGPYQIGIIDHQLITQSILRCEELKPSLWEEIRYKKEEEMDEIIEIPEFIKNDLHKRLTLFDQRTQTIMVNSISERGTLDKKMATLTLKLSFDDELWQLKGKLDEFSGYLSLHAEFEGDEIIDFLLSKIHPQADLIQRRIPQDPVRLKPVELNNFRKGFTFHNLDTDKWGEFSEIKLSNVEIYPESNDKAQQWAEILFIENLSEYITPLRYEQLWISLMEKFPVLNEFDLIVPPISTLWERVAFGSRKCWFLRAAIDMNLEEVL